MTFNRLIDTWMCVIIVVLNFMYFILRNVIPILIAK